MSTVFVVKGLIAILFSKNNLWSFCWNAIVVAKELAKAEPYLFHIVIFHHFSIFDFQRLYSSSFPKTKAKGIKADTTGTYQFEYGFPSTKGSRRYVKPSELCMKKLSLVLVWPNWPFGFEMEKKLSVLRINRYPLMMMMMMTVVIINQERIKGTKKASPIHTLFHR